jgi:hypothetical protein
VRQIEVRAFEKIQEAVKVALVRRETAANPPRLSASA